MTKKTFFIQGCILTGVSLLMRITNIGYRSFLSQQIGAEGMGLYQLIFSIFMLAVTLSTSGISLAVTRMVSAAIATNRRNHIRSIVSKCFTFCLCCSLTISIVLFFTSDIAALFLLGNPAAATCLRILGFGLPFMAMCTCMKGYFLSVNEAVHTSIADMLEQFLTIAVTIFLFWYFAPHSIEAACLAAMVAATLGEATSFAFGFISYRISLRKNTPKDIVKSHGVMRGLLHIALPCTLSSAARSALNTGENLLIPKQLQKYGMSYSSSMAQYGLLQGMAMPMLFFPSSFLFSFALLLIPKIAEERELGHNHTVSYITGKAICNAMIFGFFFASIFIFFGDTWSVAFYKNNEAGIYLKVLAPLVPLIYLDVVVDNLLKGLDEQFNSMKYNLADSMIRVSLVFCLLPIFGIKSYIAILFFSTIFNAALSLHRLLKVTQVRIFPIKQILIPALAACSSVLFSKALLENLDIQIIILVAVQTIIAGIIFLSLLYILPKQKMQSIISPKIATHSKKKDSPI